MNEKERLKVIIVDDDEFLVNMYAGKFGHIGVEVLALKSGLELLEKLKAGESADLILLDIVLPEFDGLETLESIRNEKLANNVPIIMLTNQSDDQGIAQSTKYGVAGYIVKASATPSEVVEQSIKTIKKSK